MNELLARTTEVGRRLEQWLQAAIDGVREALPMFGCDRLEVVERTGALEDLGGAYLVVEDDEHAYTIGVLEEAGRRAQVATLLLGPADPGAPFGAAETHDALREIANIIAGAVKTRMLPQHGRLVLGLPFVADGVLDHGVAVDRRLVAIEVGEVGVWLAVERKAHSAEKLRAIALERQLAEQEQKLSGILRAAADGIVTLAETGAIDMVNPSAAALFGVAANACPGRDLAEFVPSWRAVWRPGGGDRAAAQVVGETVLRRQGGVEIPVELSVARFVCKAGPMLAVVLRDVRERKAIEHDLRQAQKMEAIGRLAAGLAHEMNTPAQYAGDSIDFVRTACADLVGLVGSYRAGLAQLAPAPGHAQVAARLADAEVAADFEFLAENVPAACARTREGIDRIASIVRAMRSFADTEGGALAPVDLNELVRATLTIGAAEFRQVADLETELGDLPPVTCQRADIGQVLLALVVNAAQAIADKRAGSGRGRIRIATRRAGAGVAIVVADDGCGIPPAIRERVFDPFFTTREVGAGQGQGLTQARNVIEGRHAGSITFASRVGEGTEFTVWLPCAAAA